MSKSRKTKKRRRKSSFWDKIIVLLSLVLIVLVGMIGYTVVGNILNPKDVVVNKPIDDNVDDSNNNNDKIEEEKEPSEYKINVALFGIDALAIHSDVNMIASFDTKTNDLSLISIPRDTKVTMTQEIQNNLSQRGKYIPVRDGKKGVCKLTEVYAYAGKDYANEFQVKTIEDLLGIEIDYYVAVDTSGFRDVVDAIGGVDMEVKDRLYYSDPEQGLYIDLYPGYQHLDGDKAEQLVRYRDGYASKDLKRIEVQRDFMKEMLKKVTSTETLIKSAPSLIKTMYNYVTTDIGITDALKHLEYLDDISMDKFYSETIPGEGGSYFTVDEIELKKMVDRIFYSHNPSGEVEEENTETGSSEKFKGKIEISNGGSINGLASKKAEILKSAGYDVASVTNFSGTQNNKTRIVVSSQGLGNDMKEYFPDAVIEVNSKLLSVGIDMKIILGLDEK